MSRKTLKGRNVKITESVDFEKLLERLPIELRGKKLLKAVRAGGRVVARAMDKGAPVEAPNLRNPDGVQLKDTHTVKGIVFKNGSALAIVGAEYPIGAHSHLQEDGHEVVVSRGSRAGMAPLSGSAFVPGKQYMTKAIAATESKVNAAVTGSLERDIAKASKG